MEDYNFIECTKELHVFNSDHGVIPHKIISIHGRDILRLDLTSCQLRTSKELSLFTNIEELILDNNDLRSLELSQMLHLHTLSLNKNKLEDLDEVLAALQRCAMGLRHLSLLGNPCSPDQLNGQHYTADDYARHRLYVLHMLPWLQFLDSSAVTRRERFEAKRRGRYCRTVRLLEWAAPTGPASAEWGRDALDTDLTLPAAADGSERHGPVYGQLSYNYLGRHSEGNRFIRNCDL